MRKNKKLEINYHKCEIKVANPITDNIKSLSEVFAEKIDYLILNDIAYVYAKYGFELNKDLFLEVLREYAIREEEKRCQDQDF